MRINQSMVTGIVIIKLKMRPIKTQLMIERTSMMLVMKCFYKMNDKDEYINLYIFSNLGLMSFNF